MKKLLFVTGTRADFGKLEPLAVAVRDHGFDVSFWVTGMHMMERYGLTKIEVQRIQGVGVAEFSNQYEGDPQDVILATTLEKPCQRDDLLFCRKVLHLQN